VKSSARIAALACVVALGAVGCAQKPTSNNAGGGGSNGSAASNKSFKACMVSDSGGFDDKSFNQTSYKGLLDAVKTLHISMAKVESNSDSDYANNVAGMVSQKCNIIVTVGFKLGTVTEKSAKQNPNIDYAIVDYGYAKPPPNLKGLQFNTAQSSFLAGYLAAGMTKTGKVGTFGGINIPTVTIYMDGFWEGVQYYNQHHGTHVQVLGWDEKTQKGLFTNDFEDKNKGQVTATNLIQQGADIVFPVAGPAGLGALQAAQSSGGKVNAIWVDTDGCISAPEYCSVIMTSVAKGMDVAVEAAIKSALEKKFSNASYVGTLANGGTGITPYHTFDTKIPAALKSQIAKLKQEIIAGKITIKSKAQPTS
jgi:basic membrane protein A and related proteins